ncbi:MAG: hypothetical protein NDI73_04605 [Desulfuromonadales bacterium]|nr:hypothetical protein [Desulfuromonadales bacterium]
MGCEKQQTCSFFSEFKDDVERRQYQLFVRSYCLGTLKDTCKRRAFEHAHGVPAPDSLCPYGFRYRSFRDRSTCAKASGCEA